MPVQPGSRMGQGAFSAIITTILAAGGLILGSTDFTSYVDLAEIAAPAASSAGEARLYADSTAHRLKASCNTGAYGNVARETDANNFTADQTLTGGANALTVNTPASNDANAGLISYASGATVKPLVLQVHASQTANALEVQNSSNGVLFARDPGGRAQPRYLTEYFEDYLWCTLGTASITSTSTGPCFLVRVTNGGTGQVVTRSTIGGRNTVIAEATTGANSAGGGGHATSPSMLFGAGGYTCEMSVRLEDLSDGTDTYTTYLGFVDFGGGGTVAAPVDGAYVSYTHSANSGKFQFSTINNSSASDTDTGVTVAADTWYTIRIDVNSAGTSATCTINGTASSGGAIATNIPTAAGRETGIGWGILKSAGATPRLMYCDYVYYAVGSTSR